MSYVLYLDKNENFECSVDVTNASLKNSTARLVVESNDLNLLFPGRIENGQCIIPIKKLKGLIGENETGTIRLEVIVEDMFFSPWKSEFIVEQHTSVKVKVNEQKEVSKPAVTVRVNETRQQSAKKIVIGDIVKLLNEQRITRQNIAKRLPDARKVIHNYFAKNDQYNKYKMDIISEIVKEL